MIKKVQLDMIARRLHEGRCVPFLGAAVNIRSRARKYRGLPVGNQLVKEFRAALEHRKTWPVALARAALEYEVSSDRENLVTFLNDKLPEHDVEPSPALRVLARLPLRLVITTNYDCLLERALAESGREFTCLVQPHGGFDDTRATRDRLESLEQYEGTIVYKIHGTFDRNGYVASRHWLKVKPEVTVTEDDYIEFLAVNEKAEAKIGVPNCITRLITPNMLLFLGYALDDWDFRTIHRRVIERLNVHQERSSIAIQQSPPDYWVDYWINRGIKIVDMDVYDFCELLEQRFFELYPVKAG